MKYFVVEPFTLETPQGNVTLPAGKILELTLDQAARMKGKVGQLPEKPVTDGRGLSHYCKTGACWCSALLPGRDHPADCIRLPCEYYKD